jgi:hypothetical protein
MKVRLKDVPDRVPFLFVHDGEDRPAFEGVCYQSSGVIYAWDDGSTLGVCTGVRQENPWVELRGKL